MDILDIDEALKDDSFIFLEDKTHDDVSNILQQWKSNNCQIPQPQQQDEQVYKLNSKTFTRPKRKLAQNLESQFLNTSPCNDQQYNQRQQSPQQQQHRQCQQPQTGEPILNLEIGGLVTNMHKSLLQDTSPPPSICSSMDVSMERMNNSLITSADFSNINFLQSTQSFNLNDMNSLGEFNFNLTDKMIEADGGYTLSDMIRDRKALESLTMSGDGTFIKDSHIGQIDDISLTLSKTASGCSTMNNSTDSASNSNNNNRTIESANREGTEKLNSSEQQRTMVLSDEMIGDTTFNLVENSMRFNSGERVDGVSEKPLLNETHNVRGEEQQTPTGNATFHKAMPLDSTVCISSNGNTTFDCQPQQPLTPERNLASIKYYESTPQATNGLRYIQRRTPSIKLADDANISPIIAAGNFVQLNATRVLNASYERDANAKTNIISDTFCGALPKTDTTELLEDITNPNETFNKHRYEQTAQIAAGIEMQNVMDLAQAEAELLAGNDDEEKFEQMLDKFSKVELNAEQLKMKKSLDTIKRRFNYGHNNDKCGEREREVSSNLSAEPGEVYDDPTVHHELTRGLQDSSEVERILTKNITREFRESPRNGLSPSNKGSTSCNDRLLSRRSRLYDDIKLPTASTSLTVQKTDNQHERELKMSETTQRDGLKTEMARDEIELLKKSNQEGDAAAHKLAEKRERDRDRFKTIKITKQYSTSNDKENASGIDLNVPCIDCDDIVFDNINSNQNNTPTGGDSQTTQNTESSLRNADMTTTFISGDSESGMLMNIAKTASRPESNYLTYKKPKEKLALHNNHLDRHYQTPREAEPSIAAAAGEIDKTITTKSRPRYISGLQKFNVVSKATSASDLEKTMHAQTTTRQQQIGASAKVPDDGGNKSAAAFNANRTQPPLSGGKSSASNLKSPMGIKSKSFHNLSSNFGYSSSSVSNARQHKTAAYGLEKNKRSGDIAEHQVTVPSKSSATALELQQQSNDVKQIVDDMVFKVPKLVSGIRYAGGGGKRAGLVRPSSGFYSLNMAPKVLSQTIDVDADAGRHSPTESMSSASSRSSVQSIGAGLKPNNSDAPAELTVTPSLTKNSTGSSGAHKPSGLRPPTSIKRSGLPRPLSIIKR